MTTDAPQQYAAVRQTTEIYRGSRRANKLRQRSYTDRDRPGFCLNGRHGAAQTRVAVGWFLSRSVNCNKKRPYRFILRILVHAKSGKASAHFVSESVADEVDCEIVGCDSVQLPGGTAYKRGAA